MAAEPLSEAAVEAALKELNGWAVEGDALVKTFSLPRMRQASCSPP